MSDPDRGAYTPPTDSPLTFDARRPVRGGGGPNSSTLMISAIILVLLVAGAGFWLYKDGQRGANDQPQPVGTVVAETKGPPPVQAQPEDETAGLQIYKQDDLAQSEPTFAPGPEPVQPRPAPRAQPVTPVQTAALKPTLPAGATPARPVAAQPQPTQVAVATPKPPAPKAAMPAIPPKSAAGAAMVQIGAFSSEALADKGWSDAASVAPGLAAGKGKQVEAIDKEGKTLFRTSVTGFSTRAEAQTFCERLKGAGKSCFVK